MRHIKSFLQSYKLIIIAIIIGICFYLLALTSFNEVQSRLVGVIAFLVTLWTNNGLHMGVVSLLPIILFPIFGLVESKDVVSNYSKTTIFLFIGGFLIAIATEKSELHKRLATFLLSIFPNTPRAPQSPKNPNLKKEQKLLVISKKSENKDGKKK